MSLLMVGCATLAFAAPLLWSARRSTPMAAMDRAVAGHPEHTGSAELTLLSAAELLAATQTSLSLQALLNRLAPAPAWREPVEQVLARVAGLVQLLPGSDIDAPGGLWRECLETAARALDWPACGRPACPRPPYASQAAAARLALAAVVAGALHPLRLGLARLDVRLLSDAGARPWIPMLGPMSANVWGARRYTVARCDAALSADRQSLYRGLPALLLEHVLPVEAADDLRRDVALHAELIGFLGAERSTRFDAMVAPMGSDCQCFACPDPSGAAQMPAARGREAAVTGAAGPA